jgi:hypothetical protein
MSKSEKDAIDPHIDSLFKNINKLIAEHGLRGYSVKEITIARGHKKDLKNCPCGVERVRLPSGKIVEQCKKCPPPPTT